MRRRKNDFSFSVELQPWGSRQTKLDLMFTDCTLSRAGHLHPTHPVSASIDQTFSFTLTHFKRMHLRKEETFKSCPSVENQQYLPYVKGGGRCGYIPVALQVLPLLIKRGVAALGAAV